MTVSFLQELDERQSRLGYVACLALVASRELDDRDALRERFLNLAFARIFRSDPQWKDYLALIDQQDIEELKKWPSRKKIYTAIRGRPSPPYYFSSDLWLKQRTMPSKTAPLDPERAE